MITAETKWAATDLGPIQAKKFIAIAGGSTPRDEGLAAMTDVDGQFDDRCAEVTR